MRSSLRSRVAACSYALALAACAHSTLPAHGTAGPPAELRVLVYNIHAGQDAAGASNIARVAALVRESGADLALLQEVDRGTRRSGGVDQPTLLARLTGMTAVFGRTLDYDGGEYGIAVLSRWRVMRDTLVHLPTEPAQSRAGGSIEPRGALWVTIASPWGALSVVNTHLDASGVEQWRRQEVHALLALARGAASRDGPLLVGGDLNSKPDAAAPDTLRRAGLRDAWATCGEGEGFTFPSVAPVRRIDYLFLPDGPRCLGARVLDGEASDHRALLVRLALPR